MRRRIVWTLTLAAVATAWAAGIAGATVTGATHSGPAAYTPGQEVILTYSIPYNAAPDALGLEMTVPTGWKYKAVVGVGGVGRPDVRPALDSTGVLSFAWFDFSEVPTQIDCTVRVLTDAADMGNKSISAVIKGRFAGGAEQSFTVTPNPLVLTGPAPQAAVTPASKAFGDVYVSQNSAQVITLANQGTAPLTVSALTLSDTTNFELALGTCASVTPTVAAGADCTVSVTFKPGTVAAFTGKLTVASDDPTTPSIDVDLTGTGLAFEPDIAVTPLTKDFGSVVRNTNSPAQEVLIKNDGPKALVVAGMLLSDSSHFSLNVNGGGNPCGSVTPTVAGGLSCTVQVTFHPKSEGAFSAKLTITSDDPDEASVEVALSGTGTATPVPDINVTPTTLTFGNVEVGKTSAAQTVTVSNTGTAALAIASVVATGNATDFTLTNGCGASVAAGASCTVTVAFKPLTVGAKTATVTVTSNDPDEGSVVVTATGTGDPIPVADIKVAPASLAFGSAQMGTTTAAQTVTLTNDAAATQNLVVSGITLSSATHYALALGTCPSLAPTLTPGTSCTVTVAFSPTAVGALAANLIIASNDPDQASLALGLTGTGTVVPVPDVAVTPASNNFGTVAPGTTSAATTFTVRNNGTANLSVSKIELSPAANFVLDATGGATACGSVAFVLTPTQSCTVQVSAAPAAKGRFTADLTVSSNDPDSPTTKVGLIVGENANEYDSSGDFEKITGCFLQSLKW